MAAIDPGRVVADLRELDGPDRRRRRRPARRLDRHLEGGQRLVARRARGHRRRHASTRDAAGQHLGHRCRASPSASSSSAATSTRCPTAAGSTASSTSSRASRCCARTAPESRPLTLKLVDWADEEGARFGRSLLGSSAAAGTLEPDAVRGLHDRDGIALPDALRRARRRPRPHARRARERCEGAAAYLELHIEQGPVLESIDKPLGRRARAPSASSATPSRFTGRHAHAGSTPMDLRRDAFLAAARSALAFREDARRRATTCAPRPAP